MMHVKMKDDGTTIHNGVNLLFCGFVLLGFLGFFPLCQLGLSFSSLGPFNHRPM